MFTNYFDDILRFSFVSFFFTNDGEGDKDNDDYSNRLMPKKCKI